MSLYSIRPATIDDAQNLAALSIQVWLDTYAREGMRKELSEYVLHNFTAHVFDELISDPNVLFRVVERENHLIGYIQITSGRTTEITKAAMQAEVDHLYMHATFCRQGIGRLLLQQVEEELFARGIEVLWLTVWIENHRAKAFYTACGYEDRGTVHFELGEEQIENRVFVKLLDHSEHQN